jgi:hypothetical protein
MIVKIKPVDAKINVSRQNGELVTTRRWFTIEDHLSNIGFYAYNKGFQVSSSRFQVRFFPATCNLKLVTCSMDCLLFFHSSLNFISATTG